MKKKLPKFKSEKEEAEFWNKHSALDYPNEFSEIKDPFKFSPSLLKKIAEKHKEKKKCITLRMESSTTNLAKIIANKQKEHYQTLIRMWIKERILKELKRHPEIEEEIRDKNIQLIYR